jgi:predicted NUDIX family phosphoesterase
MKSEFLRVAKSLFEKYKTPMSAKELVNLGIEDKVFSDNRAGLTPAQTMKAKLSVHIRRHGAASPFVRTKPGHFFLRRLLDPTQPIYEAPPLNPPAPTERVLVFPASTLDRIGRFQGISLSWRRYQGALLKHPPCGYLDRIPAEQDDHNKQVLTYILVTRGAKLLAFKRGTFNRVEDFLRGSHCVGFGGHIAESDLTLFNTADLGLFDSAIRELSEELLLPNLDVERLSRREGLTLVGVLNDDSSPAGRRHFAFLFRYEVSEDAQWNRPERNEKSITQLRWLEPNEGNVSLRQFEYWSQLALRSFYPTSVHVEPAFLVRRRRPFIPPHVLCVIGPVGSGKSEATSILREEFEYLEINSGRILAQLLGIPPVPETSREEIQRRGMEFITEPSGPTTLAAAIWREIAAAHQQRILVDGIRQAATLRVLASLADSHGMRFAKLFVHTPPDVAYRFYKSRSESPLRIQEFLKLREADVEREVYSMIGSADAVLYNWAGKPMYRNAVRGLMKEVES